jgi:thymidylate synthase
VELVIKDLREDYVKICRDVVTYGEMVYGRGTATKEWTGVTLLCPDPTVPLLPVGVGRRVNLKLAALEALGMIAGEWPWDLITRVAPLYSSVLVSGDDPGAAQYAAYGPRISRQLPVVLDMLREDNATRQAVLQIWKPEDLTHQGDRPCTISLQFLRRNAKLECHTYMRSQDVWLGLAMDVFVFTQLQLTMAAALGVSPGKYVHHVGSLHAYQRDFERIHEMAEHPISAAVDELPQGLRVVKNPQIMASLILAGSAQSSDNEWYLRQMALIRKIKTNA